MFALQLDLKMYFCPPMEESGNAIRLTRTLQLPFPPYNELAIYSTTHVSHPDHEGFVLKNVVWDMDRSRFTAEATMIHQDLPLAYIVEEVASWTTLGWKFGSFMEDYQKDSDALEEGLYCNDEELAHDNDSEADNGAVAIDTDEQMPNLLPAERPQAFNRLFRALIRTVCQEGLGNSTVYAMWKTKRFFTDRQLDVDTTLPARQFASAKEEFKKMPPMDRYYWAEKVCRTLPRLDKMIAEAVSSKSSS